MTALREQVRRILESRTGNGLLVIVHKDEPGLTEFLIAPIAPLFDANALRAYTLEIFVGCKPNEILGFWRKRDYHFGELLFHDASEQGAVPHQSVVRAYPCVAIAQQVARTDMSKAIMGQAYVKKYEDAVLAQLASPTHP